MTQTDPGVIASAEFDHERFKNIASGIQSYVAALGLAVAGLWVAFSFVALKSEQKARAEIAALEFSAKQEPVLQFDLTASSLATSGSGPRMASFQVRVRNDGKRALEFEAPTLRVLRISATDQMPQPIGATAEYLDSNGKLEAMPSRILRSGQTRTIALFAVIPEPGDYLVQLDSTYFGMTNLEGKLVVSKDEAIQAIEQQIVSLK